MSKNINFSLKLIFAVILTFGLTVSLQSILADWTPPSAPPPDNNVSKPIWASSTIGQYTDNNLAILGSLDVRDDITALGQLGIGTNNPNQLLEVYGGASDVDAYVDVNVAAGGKISRFGSRAGYGVVFGAATYNNLGLITNNNVALTITPTHYVGIGSSSPSSKLVVTNTGSVHSLIIEDQQNDPTPFVIDAAGNVGIGLTGPDTKLYIRDNSGGANANFRIGGSVTSGYTTDISMDNEGLKIGHNSGSRDLRLRTGNTDRITIRSNGNVGINTATPNARLEVVGSILQQNTDTLIAKNSAGTSETWMWPRWSDNIMYTNYGSGGWAIRNNASQNVMFMQNGGNVGIGTTNPDTTLTVNGAIEHGRLGTYGTYNSTQVQGIWTIGRGYPISILNNNFGNQYGIVYAHTNAGATTIKQPISGWGHQILFTSDGNRTSAISLTSGHAWFSGTVTAGAYAGGGCDIAEKYSVSSRETEEMGPGDVLVIDTEEAISIKKSRFPYDTNVIGVYSTEPSMTMGVAADGSNADDPPVALLGRVPTKVTAENGPIKIGDYIVTSSRSGYGMRCEEYDKCRGAIVGKALENLEGEIGLIEVLIKGGF